MTKILPFLFIISVFLTSCGGKVESEAKYPVGDDRGGNENIYKESDSIFGSGGILGGNKDKDKSLEGIVVNGYLWRASLDTISFMPLASADPFGGVILTDWYISPDAPNERLKLNVFVVGSELSANALTVRVFKQKLSSNRWNNSNVSDDVARALEDTILTRARQLRLADVEKK